MKKLLLLLTLSASTVFADVIQDAQRAFEGGNEAEAFRILEKAAQAGNAQALYNLSVFYSNGIATAPDDKKALQLLEQSANKGFIDAQKDLVEYYLAQPDFTKAAKWMKILADKGDAAAQYGYALLLLNGQGVKVDIKQSEKYLRLSMDNGFQPAHDFIRSLEEKAKAKGAGKNPPAKK